MATLLFTVVATLMVYAGAMPPTEFPPTTTPGGVDCEYDNKTYPPGEFFPGGPCYPCMCHGDGEVQCPYIIYDCIIGCVDPVYPKDQCCPSCPNGFNCYAPDGSVIPAGEPVEMPSGETCVCPEDYPFFSQPSPALCLSPYPSPVSSDGPTSTSTFTPTPEPPVPPPVPV